MTCSVDSCQRPVSARGLCKMHYDRWTRTGSTDRHKSGSSDQLQPSGEYEYRNDFPGLGIARCHVCDRPAVEHSMLTRCGQ